MQALHEVQLSRTGLSAPEMRPEPPRRTAGSPPTPGWPPTGTCSRAGPRATTTTSSGAAGTRRRRSARRRRRWTRPSATREELIWCLYLVEMAAACPTCSTAASTSSTRSTPACRRRRPRRPPRRPQLLPRPASRPLRLPRPQQLPPRSPTRPPLPRPRRPQLLPSVRLSLYCPIRRSMPRTSMAFTCPALASLVKVHTTSLSSVIGVAWWERLGRSQPGSGPRSSSSRTSTSVRSSAWRSR
mmetsp:Transcript_30389/g.87066  ORF Transcript_30389/g.87066 Transcript_30389/m.87066 type:complete len:242 (+) Transcript_30389:703-1428(+)